VIQNTDTTVRFTLKDSAGVAIAISSLSAYEIYVYRIFNNQKIIVASYKDSNTGIYDIVVNDGPNGKIDIILNREITSKTEPSKLYAEVRIRKTATSAFISSLQNLGEEGMLIGELKSTINSNSLL
jgi:hypothetical protein